MAKQRVIGFTPDSAKRISSVVQAYEHDRRPGVMGAGGGGRAGVLIIGKTSAAWTKGTQAKVPTYWGKPGAEKATGKNTWAWNLFGDIPTGKWVAIIDGYVIAAEC